jgi:hypothetical protein
MVVQAGYHRIGSRSREPIAYQRTPDGCHPSTIAEIPFHSRPGREPFGKELEFVLSAGLPFTPSQKR